MKSFIIYYSDLNIKQIKNLINHNIHEKAKAINNREIPIGLSRKELKDFNDETDKLRKAFLKPYGNYFTNKSPLFDAIKTGILDCNNQKFNVIFNENI